MVSSFPYGQISFYPKKSGFWTSGRFYQTEAVEEETPAEIAMIASSPSIYP
jgi:hypothetical protein